jgi:hypothetical protein
VAADKAVMNKLHKDRLRQLAVKPEEENGEKVIFNFAKRKAISLCVNTSG